MRRPRALYLTMIAPSHRTGGGRHALANLRALCDGDRLDVDYVGVPFDPSDVGAGCHRRLRVSVARRFGWRDKVSGLAVGAATGLRGLLLEHLRAHPPPDLALIESTLCGFAFADLPPTVPTACVVHNVEADYARLNEVPLRWRARAAVVARSERLTVGGADALMVLHEHDERALVARYGPPRGAVSSHPVCAFGPGLAPRPLAERPRQLVYVGSLDLSYNHDAIMAFLARCWPRLARLGHRLVVAGWRPRPTLRAAVAGADGVTLLPNAPDVGAVLRDSCALLLPDASGTGMKLRVAEALSHGVPVVGTEAGLRGYEPERGVAVLTAPAIDGMVPLLEGLLADSARHEAMAVAARAAWRTRLSYEPFAARVDAVVSDLLAGRKAARRPKPILPAPGRRTR